MNDDGGLSFEEFKGWFQQAESLQLSAEDRTIEGCGEAEDGEEQQHEVSYHLQDVKHLTHLDRFAPTDIFEMFATQASEEGLIHRRQFLACLDAIDEEVRKVVCVCVFEEVAGKVRNCLLRHHHCHYTNTYTTKQQQTPRTQPDTFTCTTIHSALQVGGHERVDHADLRNVLGPVLFEAFDVDQDGMVDFTELASGISVLCGGSREEKVRA